MILAPEGVSSTRAEDLELILFGESQETSIRESFELEFALQGEEGIVKVRESVAREAPFAVAFVDMRMPPGIDGLDTISGIWEIDPDIQIVIAIAYSDHSTDEIADRLGRTDQVLILRKPFEPVKFEAGAHSAISGWEISVADDGVGVDLKHRDSIFDLFLRLHDHEGYPGTGVGLAICRRILERHGGRIWMESAGAKGESGTVVRLVIPEIADGGEKELTLC